MTRRRLLASAALVIAALAIAASFKIRDHRSTSVAIQIHERESLGVAGEQRTYCLIVPQPPPGQPAPLFIAFHGMGESAATMVDYARLNQLAAEHGALVALPEMSHGTWTAHGPDAVSSQNPDVLLFDALLNQLEEQYPVDTRRVYVLGMSNGASFAQLLMQLRSTRIAAVVAHSGSPPRESANVVPERPCPIMLLVGRDDSPFVVDDVTDAARTYRESGQTVELITVDGLEHAWSREHDGAIWEFLTRHRLPKRAAPVPTTSRFNNAPTHTGPLAKLERHSLSPPASKRSRRPDLTVGDLTERLDCGETGAEQQQQHHGQFRRTGPIVRRQKRLDAAHDAVHWGAFCDVEVQAA